MSVYHLRGVLQTSNGANGDVQIVQEAVDPDDLVLVDYDHPNYDGSAPESFVTYRRRDPATDRLSGEVNLAHIPFY